MHQSSNTRKICNYLKVTNLIAHYSVSKNKQCCLCENNEAQNSEQHNVISKLCLIEYELDRLSNDITISIIEISYE